MRTKRSTLIGLAAALGATIAGGAAAHAQNVSSQTLRSVAAIVTGEGGRRTAVGAAFFVDVPSKLYTGSTFVYLLTARHNLLDAKGGRLSRLWLRLEGTHSATVQDQPLPAEDQWILDPQDEDVDLAALPYPPGKGNFSTIPLSWFLGSESATTIPLEAQIGAEAYYLTMTGSGAVSPRFVAVTRFARVSVAEPTRTEVRGAGVQELCFLDGAGAADFSGAPVFLRTASKFVFWGMLEAGAQPSAGALSGLVGVLPASYIARTVQAMADAQERGHRSHPAP